MPQCACGQWYSTSNYAPDRPEDLCPTCYYYSTPKSYVSRDYVCGHISGTVNLSPIEEKD